MSRDPDGINLLEEYGTQLEPSGTLPDDFNASTMTTPVASGDGMKIFPENGEGQILLDITKFIGLPPPPPTSTPPKKKKVRRSKAANVPSTSAVSAFKESPLVTENEEAGIPHENSNDTGEVLSERSKSSSPRARNIVQERLQMAKSMYESDVLLLEEQHEPEKSAVSPSARTEKPEEIEAATGLEVSELQFKISEDSVPDGEANVVLSNYKSKNKEKKRKKRRGFFKNLFGPGKSREEASTDGSGPIDDDRLITMASSASENDSLPKEPEPVDKPFNVANLSNKVSLLPEEGPDDEMSAGLKQTSSTTDLRSFSLDPPDDDSGDPSETSGRLLGSPVSRRVERETIDGDQIKIETKESVCMEPTGASPVGQEYIRGNYAVSLSTGDPCGDTLKARYSSKVSSNDPQGASLCHESLSAKSSPDPELSTVDNTAGISLGRDVPEVDEEVSSLDGTRPEPSISISNIPDVRVDGPIDADVVHAQTEPESPSKLISLHLKKLSAKASIPWAEDKRSISAVSKKIEKTRAMLKSSSLGNQEDNQGDLESQFEMEKTGFNKLASDSSTEGKEMLTVNAAAFTNAKAIAYLHKLQGEASPRHTYHSKHSLAPPLLEKSVALAKIRKFNAKRKQGKGKKVMKAKGPSPDEYSAANSEVQEQLNGPPKKNYVNHDPSKQFAAYSRFQGRRPRKANDGNQKEGSIARNTAHELNEADSIVNLAFISSSDRISGLAISRGLELKEMKRNGSFEDARLEDMILKSRRRPNRASRFNFFPAAESEIKDPIQRAGRRLLSKAAIPIQANIRMFLAKSEAINRMWAIIRLQSYFRRWRCETELHVTKTSALSVQKAFRGYVVRKDLKHKNDCATSIQKIVRGYLCALHAYEAIYYVSRAQALVRGYLVRSANGRRAQAVLTLQTFFKKSLQEKIFAAAVIQKHYLEYSLRQRERRMYQACATAIQTNWRTYSARIAYETDLVDIITVQTIVRRRTACRTADLIRKSIHTNLITNIQAVWRGFDVRNRQQKSVHVRKIQRLWRSHTVKNHYAKSIAATKIQASWRGFSAYSDFIFVVVDILVVQRTVRQWLATRKVNELRRERAAVFLQSAWRRRQAQVALLYSLVHIIMVQSVARRFLAKKQVQAQQEKREQSLLVERRKDLAATAIQKSWRGFWGFSHFIIVRYEITRIQALMRGKLARDEYNLKIGCAILIQAVARRFLARKASATKVIDRVVLESRALELRERNSAKHIQFWWRIVLDYMKEKKAALVIERFFIFVKSEVDKELRQIEQKRIMKQKAKNKYVKGLGDDQLDNVRVSTGVKKNSRNKSAPRSRPPQKKFAPRDSNAESFGVDYMEPPPEFLHLGPRSDFSVVSTLTNPTILNQFSKEMETPRAFDVNNEEKFQEVKARPKNRLSTEDYIKKYGSGLQTAPNNRSKAQSQHFFSDDGSSKDMKPQRRSLDGISSSHSQSHNKVNPPRVGRAKSGQPMLSTVGLDNSDPNGRIPSTPRSRSGSTPRTVSRSHRDGNSSQSLPPVTPTRKKTALIMRAATADTECSTLDNENMSTPPRPSSRRHSGIQNRGGNGVKVLKSFPDYRDDRTFVEAHEMMLLGDDYGEV